MSDIGHNSKLWLTYSLLVLFVAADYQNFFDLLDCKFNATHCRVVFECGCLVNEFEIPFHLVVSHLFLGSKNEKSLF